MVNVINMNQTNDVIDSVHIKTKIWTIWTIEMIDIMIDIMIEIRVFGMIEMFKIGLNVIKTEPI